MDILDYFLSILQVFQATFFPFNIEVCKKLAKELVKTYFQILPFFVKISRNFQNIFSNSKEFLRNFQEMFDNKIQGK